MYKHTRTGVSDLVKGAGDSKAQATESLPPLTPMATTQLARSMSSISGVSATACAWLPSYTNDDCAGAISASETIALIVYLIQVLVGCCLLLERLGEAGICRHEERQLRSKPSYRLVKVADRMVGGLVGVTSR